MKKRVQSHVLEKVIFVLMVIFGFAAIVVLWTALNSKNGLDTSVAMLEILIIVVLAILGQTVVLIKIYEQHQ